MSHDRINYLEILHDHGLRMTPQRQVVLEAICTANGHATIQEIYYQSKQIDQSIDRSTVYRSLDLFVNLGITVTAESLAGEKTYELVQENRHHHLICAICGQELEIDPSLVSSFYQQINNFYGYLVEMDHLILHGTCPGCREPGG